MGASPGKPRRNPLLGAAVLKALLQRRSGEGLKQTTTLYEGVLRDLNLSDAEVEGFLADGLHPFSDVMALDAIRRLFDSLPRAKAAPSEVSVRTENQLAAWFSFTLPAQSAGGLSHVMGKQIGARHGVPHGVTSCLLLPHVIRYFQGHTPERVALLGAATGIDPAGRVQGLIESLGLPQHIAAYGISEPELRKAAGELAGKYPAEDLLGIYLAAL